jgi:hypothetical protein
VVGCTVLSIIYCGKIMKHSIVRNDIFLNLLQSAAVSQQLMHKTYHTTIRYVMIPKIPCNYHRYWDIFVAPEQQHSSAILFFLLPNH